MSLVDAFRVCVRKSGLMDNVEVCCTHIRQVALSSLASSTTTSCSLDILLVNRSISLGISIGVHISITSFIFLLNVSLFHVNICTLHSRGVIVGVFTRSWHFFEYVVLDRSSVLLYLTNKVTGIVG